MAGRVVRGGTAVYGAQLGGAPLGILMLDARFPRIPGDMGHAGTLPFPVLCRVVRGTTPARVVLDGAAGLLPAFLDAAAELVALGAEAIRPTAAPCRCSSGSVRRMYGRRWRHRR